MIWKNAHLMIDVFIVSAVWNRCTPTNFRCILDKKNFNNLPTVVFELLDAFLFYAWNNWIGWMLNLVADNIEVSYL